MCLVTPKNMTCDRSQDLSISTTLNFVLLENLLFLLLSSHKANCSFSLCRIPGKTYMIIAFLTVGTMGLSNTSLGYLNYPTQVIFKCCKLIPVMIGGIFIQGKWISVCMRVHIHKESQNRSVDIGPV